MSDARSVLTVVGQIVGGSIGGPIGAAVGGYIGGQIGGAIDGPVRNTQALIDDLGAIKVDYGSTWTRMYGRYRVPVSPLWSSEKRAIAHEEEVDSKGGPSAVNTHYTYDQDWLCWAPIGARGFLRVWVNGELKYSNLPDADADTLEASANTDAWASITMFDGAADQMPWSVYEAAVGSENALAYRHRPTLAIESLNLGGSGQPPLVEVEFVDQPTTDLHPSVGFIAASSGYWPDFTLSFADDIEVDDVVILTVQHKADSAWTPPAGYTEVAGRSDAANRSRHRILLRLCDGTATDADIAWDDLNTPAHWNAFLVRGLETSILPVIGTGYDASSNTTDPPPVTPASGTSWFNLVVGISSTTSLDVSQTVKMDQPPSGYTMPLGQIDSTWADGGGSNMSLLVAYAQSAGPLTNATENPGTFTTTVRANGTNAFSSTLLRLPFVTNDATDPFPGADLADIVQSEALLEWTGEDGSLTESNIDVTELEGTLVTGFATTGSPRESIGQCMDDWYFGSVCSDKVYFKFRGATAVKTISFEDTGSGVDQPVEPFTGMERVNDLETSRQVALTGPGFYRDYQLDTRHSDRLEGESFELIQARTAFVFTPSELKGRADTRVYDGRVASHLGKVCLDDRHIDLEPFDVVNLTDDEGNVYRVRFMRETYADGVHEFEHVLDDPNALSRAGVTTDTDIRAITVALPGETELIVLDAPTLRDADNYPGPLIAVNGTGKWGGAAVLKSVDEASWSRIASVSTSAVAGYTTVAPIDWTGGNFFDRTSVFRVQLYSGTLSSSTRDEVLADKSVNLFALQKEDGAVEMIQAVNCDLVETGIYDLSMLLRGRFGTEDAMADHTTGESIVRIVSTEGLIKTTESVSDIGQERFFKGVTIGRSADSAEVVPFTSTGASLKPYSVSHLRAFDNGDGTYDLEWARRSRMATRFLGQYSSSVPLGEESESYKVRVYDGSDVLQSTATVSTNAATVTASSGWYAVVNQMSAEVGEGYPAEITL
jgi:hypothetical protein